MPNSIRIWGVDGDALRELGRETVDLESRLEDWMHSDIGVLSDDLLVIGRQLDTQGGGILDLLCLDRVGDLVLVELKRGKTPRDVVAQTLDYGAWVSGLSYEDVVEIGDRGVGSGDLATAFQARFGVELPEVLNDSHRLVVVSSEVDDRSERIIRYLNDTHGVAINAVTFNYFRDAEGRELLARTHLIEPELAEDRTERRPGSKRRRKVSMEDHRRTAEALGLGETFDALVDGLRPWLTPYSNITLLTLDNAEKKATANVVPRESTAADGLRFNVYEQRFCEATQIDPAVLRDLLPGKIETWSYAPDAVSWGPEWDGLTCSFKNLAAVQRFLGGLPTGS